MSHTRKIVARLRTEPTGQLPRLLRLYGPDQHASKLILQEILRRQQLQAGTYQLPTS